MHRVNWYKNFWKPTQNTTFASKYYFKSLENFSPLTPVEFLNKLIYRHTQWHIYAYCRYCQRCSSVPENMFGSNCASSWSCIGARCRMIILSGTGGWLLVFSITILMIVFYLFLGKWFTFQWNNPSARRHSKISLNLISLINATPHDWGL